MPVIRRVDCLVSDGAANLASTSSGAVSCPVNSAVPSAAALSMVSLHLGLVMESADLLQVWAQQA